MREESKQKPGQLDPVFRDWLTFAYHVGPRPSDKHQLDRINDSDNYRAGNVRWLHATRQNSNKRANRPHQYQGKRYTDAELSALLAKSFKAYSADAIKKYRQRMATAGYSNDEITREIFKRHGLSYESSGNPLEDADFSPKYHKKLTEAYRTSGSGLTRIEFEILWLQEKISILKKDQQDEMGLLVILEKEQSYKLMCRIGDLEDDLKRARSRESKLKVQKVKKDIENTEPETGCGSLTKDMQPQGISNFEKNKLATAL